MAIKKTQFETLRQYVQLGVGLTIALAFAFMSFDEFKALILNDPIHGILSVILFIITLLWFTLWIYFDNREIELFEEYVDLSKLRRLNFAPFVGALLLSILFGTLISFTPNLTLYCSGVIFVSIIESLGQYALQRRFTVIARNKDKNPQKDVADVLVEYYLFRPFYLINTLMLIACFFSFFLHYLYLQKNSLVFEYTAYVILIFTITIHESIVWYWRNIRNHEIDKLEPLESTGLVA